jgi:hypothetical protein
MLDLILLMAGAIAIFVAPLIGGLLGKYLNPVRYIGATFLALGFAVILISLATGEVPVVTEEIVSVSKLPNPNAMKIDFPVCVKAVTKTYKYSNIRQSTRYILLDPKLFDPKECKSK